MKTTQYNRFTRKFNADLSDLKFIKLETLHENEPDEVYQVTGLYINRKSQFGDRPYLSTPNFLCDLPKFMLEDIEDMINDPEVVDEINKGIVGFRVTTYYSKTYRKKCYSITFVDYNKQLELESDIPAEFK